MEHLEIMFSDGFIILTDVCTKDKSILVAITDISYVFWDLKNEVYTVNLRNDNDDTALFVLESPEEILNKIEGK